MSRPHPAPGRVLAVSALALTLLLSACGTGAEKNPKAGAASSTATASVSPQESEAPSPEESSPAPGLPDPSATVTGPSGEEPAERRDSLGGCPEPTAISKALGQTVAADPDVAANLVCHYATAETTELQGLETPVAEVAAAEPIGLDAKSTLRGYRTDPKVAFASADAQGLGKDAFVAYFEDGPGLCATWFTASDGNILTVSVILVEEGGEAGPASSACTAAQRAARLFRS